MTKSRQRENKLKPGKYIKMCSEITIQLVQVGFSLGYEFPRKRNMNLWCPQNKNKPSSQKKHSFYWY